MSHSFEEYYQRQFVFHRFLIMQVPHFLGYCINSENLTVYNLIHLPVMLNFHTNLRY